MRYLRVRWIHENPDDPVELFSELDEAGWEVRKVEVFADGSLTYAGPGGASGSTCLGEAPVPSLDTIAADPQFQPQAITRENFEVMWQKRLSPIESA